MPESGGMKPAAERLKLTYDDLLLLPEDGKRHELIDGEHYATPAPSLRHQGVSGNLYFLVRTWLEKHSVGRIFYAPLDVVFTRFDVVEPDLLYISHERARAIAAEKFVTGAPEIVVEIASRGTRSGTRPSSAGYTSARVSPNTGSSIRSSRWFASTGRRRAGSAGRWSCRPRRGMSWSRLTSRA